MRPDDTCAGPLRAWTRCGCRWLLAPAAMLGLAFAPHPAHALQLIDARDGVAVEAIVSIKEPTRIRIDGLLRHCLDGLPEDAGPLHSSVLTYRAMALMREVCPDYLQHFVAYTDALSWLEQLGGSAATGGDADGAATPRRPARTGGRRKK